MIDKIGKQCTGCYACVNTCPKDCIQMVENKEGFWFPEIQTAQCIHCNKCENSCPVLTEIPNPKTEKDVSVYALMHSNEIIRSQSSSGGAFSAIAEYVLARGGIVYGAAFDTAYNVHHVGVEKLEDMWQLRGSKYVQSRIGDIYQQVKKQLQTGRPVLFTGTACQTSGLIGYLGRDYDNLLTQDLICHGVPSPMVWRQYLRYREKEAKSAISHIFFRDKKYGWHDWHLDLQFQNGTEHSESQTQDLMIKSFLYGKCSRECCYSCKFKQKFRLADFTLADYWGIQHIEPEIDDNKGISSCYVNSKKAEKVIREISKNTYLKRMDLNLAVHYNLAMIESEKRPPDRELFLKDIRHKRFDKVVDQYIDKTGKFSLKRRVISSLRHFLGDKVYLSLRHIIRKDT